MGGKKSSSLIPEYGNIKVINSEEIGQDQDLSECCGSKDGVVK